jgi:sulfur-carrier protein
MGPMTGPETATTVRVTLRYWAGARAAAGVDSESCAGRTVGEVLAAASARHTALEPVLAVSSVLLEGLPATALDPLTDGATLEVLPPFAGG